MDRRSRRAGPMLAMGILVAALVYAGFAAVRARPVYLALADPVRSWSGRLHRPDPEPVAPSRTGFPPPAFAEPPRSIVIVGDSTSLGTVSRDVPARVADTLRAELEARLAALPPAEPWHGARVYNLAVPSSTTRNWLSSPPWACGPRLSSLRESFRVVRAACEQVVPWADAVGTTLDVGVPDVVLVHLGINDAFGTDDPRETVDRLEEIAARTAPARVLFFPPIGPPDGPRGAWPQRVRAELEARRLFDAPGYPRHVPTSDGLHPTPEGHAILAVHWTEALRRLP